VTLGGASKQRVTAYAVTGFANTPVPVWSTRRVILCDGRQPVLDAGRSGECASIAAKRSGRSAGEALAGHPQVAAAISGRTCGVHARARIRGRRRFVDDETVIVDQGLIASVGRVPAPPSRRERGSSTGWQDPRAGLWDSHMHFGDDASGPMLLALGITSAAIRAMSMNSHWRARAAAPPVNCSCPMSILRADRRQGTPHRSGGERRDLPAEALTIVRKAKADGFVRHQDLRHLHPEWLPRRSPEATGWACTCMDICRRREAPAGDRGGLRRDSPTSIRNDAGDAHAVVAQSNGIARFEGPDGHAKDVDLEAER